MANPNELTPDNSALVLIDEQPGIAMPTQSIDKASLINNVAAPASVAHALAVPTVLTTIDGHGGLLENPIFPEISAVFPDVTPIDRSTTNAWSDPQVRAAIEATGRRKLEVVATAAGTAVTVPVMTWMAMPAVTRLLRGWLFPAPGP